MPAKFARNDGQPIKRVRLDAAPRNAYRYNEGEDIERRLHVQTQNGLSEGELSLTLYTPTPLTFFISTALTVLRNQLTIKFGEGPVQPQDERLALARSWLEIAPGAQSIFNIWEQTTEVLRRVSCFCLNLC
jgi:nucleolar pre-ribosomal-associated protein 1